MKSLLIPLATLSLAAAKSGTYIISYDEFSWNTLSLSYLPSNTVHILKELKMQVAELDADEFQEFDTIPGISLHKDGLYSIYDTLSADVQQDPVNWGLDRIDQRELPLDKQYHYNSQGEGVDVWVIDTGVNVDHVEFEGRAIFEKNFADDNKDYDCKGHGTHVASIIAGKNVGVAKKATIHGVKVIGCTGFGKDSDILAGIDYVLGQHKKVPGRKSIINMSIGGPKSDAMNQAIKIATENGITVVAAAGNLQEDACNYSPSSSPDAIVVAATDRHDNNADISNYGECVTLYAPGVDIYAAFKGGNDEYKSLTGTSMASPHTAGVAALALGSGVATTPAEMKEYLLVTGTKNLIKSVPDKTPNVFLYSLGAEAVEPYPSAEVMNLVK